LQHLADQLEESIVFDISGEDFQQHMMINIVEAPFDVTFDEPFGSFPTVMDLFESGMATPVWPETM
jgi:hypothetical protein